MNISSLEKCLARGRCWHDKVKDGKPLFTTANAEIYGLDFRVGRYGVTPSKAPATQSQTSVSSRPFGGKVSDRASGNTIDIAIGTATPATIPTTKKILGSIVRELGLASQSTVPTGIARDHDAIINKRTSRTNGMSPSSTPGIEPPRSM